MNHLEDNEMLLASLQDAVERTARKRVREAMVSTLLEGCRLTKKTAEMYVDIMLRYRGHFNEALSVADAYENKLKAKLEEMARPPIAKPRVKSTTKPKKVSL
jgi:hypothetical protein